MSSLPVVKRPEPNVVDELFAVVPKEFVRARNELVLTLVADGDTAGAKRLKSLHRPTAAAWAWNQAIRSADQIEQLTARLSHVNGGRANATRELHGAARTLVTKADEVAKQCAVKLGVADRRDLSELVLALPFVDDELDTILEGRLTKLPTIEVDPLLALERSLREGVHTKPVVRKAEQSEAKLERTRLESEPKADARLESQRKAEHTRLAAQRKAEHTRLEAQRKAEHTRQTAKLKAERAQKSASAKVAALEAALAHARQQLQQLHAESS